MNMANEVSIHTSSREDATKITDSLSITEMFQSTRPRGRTRPPSAFSCLLMVTFQSTRPRGRTRLYSSI